MKNRFSIFLFSSIILLAFIGIGTNLVRDPLGFLRSIAVILGVVAIIWVVFRRLTSSNPQKKEQRAFLKAARKSKKRMETKKNPQTKQLQHTARSSSLKAKKHKRKPSAVHLTVIDGKKNKKKDRASL